MINSLILRNIFWIGKVDINKIINDLYSILEDNNSYVQKLFTQGKKSAKNVILHRVFMEVCHLRSLHLRKYLKEVRKQSIF